MSLNRKPLNLTRKTLLSGIAGVSLVVGMSLAPVSFDFQGGQLSLKSIAAYASPGSDEDAGDRSGSNKASENKASEPGGGNSESDRSSSKASEPSSGNDMSNRSSNRASELSGGKSESDRSASKDARELANNKNGGDHNSNEKDAGDRAGNDRAANQGNNNQAGGNNAAPLRLSDFISSLRKGNSVASSGGTGSNLELRYSDGWKEVIENGRYVLRDPNGNTIISRLAKNADLARLRSGS